MGFTAFAGFFGVGAVRRFGGGVGSFIVQVYAMPTLVFAIGAGPLYAGHADLLP
jgi:hypothetical protein